MRQVQECDIEPLITWWLLAVVLFFIVTYCVFIHPINHDVAWYIYESGRLLDGAKLYQDTVQFNPPLICYWAVPPVWMARQLGWPEIIPFKMYIFLLVLISLIICRQVFNRTSHASPPERRCLVLVLGYLFLRPYFFGQREHIMFVLVMPYILAAVAQSMETALNKRLLLFIGGLAGLGLALKPHFLLLWLMIESYLAFVARIKSSWRRPENAGIALVLTIYVAFVVFRVPEYYEKIVPMLLQVYSAFNCDVAYLFQHSYTKLYVVAFLAFFLIPSSPPHREIRRILLIASTSFLTIAFAQRKGFYYHFYPAAATAVLLLVIILLDSMESIAPIRRFIKHRKSLAVLVMILGLLVVASVKAFQQPQRTQDPLLSGLISIVEEHAKGEPILSFSSSVYPAFPLVNYAGAQWSSRFPCLWLLPGLYDEVSPLEKGFPYHSRDQMDAIERFFIDAVMSDILRNPPVLLIVDSSDIKQGFGKTEFDYIDYFLQDPRFSEFWPNYDFLTSVDAYRVFKQKKDPPRSWADLREKYPNLTVTLP